MVKNRNILLIVYTRMLHAHIPRLIACTDMLMCERKKHKHEQWCKFVCLPMFQLYLLNNRQYPNRPPGQYIKDGIFVCAVFFSLSQFVFVFRTLFMSLGFVCQNLFIVHSFEWADACVTRSKVNIRSNKKKASLLSIC